MSSNSTVSTRSQSVGFSARKPRHIEGIARSFSIDDPDQSLVSIPLPGAAHPLVLRRNTSDFMVIVQVFIERQYDDPLEFDHPPLIVDCGANIGCSSVFFLKRYPTATVIAVEPDPVNAAACRRNLAPYGTRAEGRECAVWSSNEPITPLGSAYMVWAYRFGPAPVTAPGSIPGVVMD